MTTQKKPTRRKTNGATVKEEVIKSNEIGILDISGAYNILFSLKDAPIKDARFSHELSMLRKQLEPIAESYQVEVQKLYDKYGKRTGQGKWNIPVESFPEMQKEVESLNKASHQINKVKGITKEYIFEIEDIVLPSTFWDTVYDKFFE